MAKKMKAHFSTEALSPDMAALTEDGTTVIAAGMAAQGYFTPEGRWVPRSELVGLSPEGLTYDYLHAMAVDLEKAGAVMLLGTGEKGTGALIFQANGRAGLNSSMRRRTGPKQSVFPTTRSSGISPGSSKPGALMTKSGVLNRAK